MKQSKYDHSIHDVLDKQDWERVIPVVLKYAVARSKKYYWLGEKVNPEELVHEAIARAYGVGNNNDYRNWNREEYPKLEDFLISIISSMTNQCAEHLRKFPEESITKEDGTTREVTSSIDFQGGIDALTSRNPEDLFVENEKLNEITEQLKSVANDDEEMGYVIMCLEDGICSRKKIAEISGCYVEKVYKIIRTLNRRLKKIKL